MKVFISSVRQGLESERDALPGIVRAIGHEPMRFEDFTSQSIPSRDACLQGVEQADVYILLIGEKYGSAMDDSGFSPTHEEYQVAKRRGIPCLMFRKKGVELEPEQAKFVAELEKYETGLFRKSFDNTADLLTKVVQALQSMPSGSLEWHPLTEKVSVSWKADWKTSDRYSNDDDTDSFLEVHAVPVPAKPVPRRRLVDLDDAMAERIRTAGIVGSAESLQPKNSEEAAWVTVAKPKRNYDDVFKGGFAGCRIASTGQRSAWERLPRDSMGVILDEADIASRIANLVRALGTIEVLDGERYAFAVGLDVDTMAVLGSISQLGSRNNVSSAFYGDTKIRLNPDEVVTPTGFGQGAEEVGKTLAKLLMNEVHRQRQ